MLIETQSISTLRKRARRLGLGIRKDRWTGGYYLINLRNNWVVGGPMSLEIVKECLDDEENDGGGD